MNEKELREHIDYLEYEYSITPLDDLENRGRIIIALNSAKEQL